MILIYRELHTHIWWLFIFFAILSALGERRKRRSLTFWCTHWHWYFILASPHLAFRVLFSFITHYDTLPRLQTLTALSRWRFTLTVALARRQRLPIFTVALMLKLCLISQYIRRKIAAKIFGCASRCSFQHTRNSLPPPRHFNFIIAAYIIFIVNLWQLPLHL